MAELMVALYERARAAGAVAAGRGRARERARHLARDRRRQDADVQRPHGHLVLGPRAVAAGRARLPARTRSSRRPALRARHLEHEGRARLLRRGGARAAGRRCAPARRRADRGRLRRDREDPVRATRRAREYRGYAAGTPVPRLARRRRRHVPARRADRGQGRARPLRRALAAHPDRTATSSTRRSARASAARTRSCACTR